jgi:hypothetical protein
MDYVSRYPEKLTAKIFLNGMYGKKMGKYIIKKWFNNQWMIVAPDHLNRALCVSFETAVNAMDIHASTGHFTDPFDHDKVPGDGNGNGEWDNV